jgi:hypothetical protein
LNQIFYSWCFALSDKIRVVNLKPGFQASLVVSPGVKAKSLAAHNIER